MRGAGVSFRSKASTKDETGPIEVEVRVERTYQINSLSILLRSLFQLSLRSSNPPITIIDEPKQCTFMLHPESVYPRVVGVGLLMFFKLFQDRLRMRLWARSEVHFLNVSLVSRGQVVLVQTQKGLG